MLSPNGHIHGRIVQPEVLVRGARRRTRKQKGRREAGLFLNETFSSD